MRFDWAICQLIFEQCVPATTIKATTISKTFAYSLPNGDIATCTGALVDWPDGYKLVGRQGKRRGRGRAAVAHKCVKLLRSQDFK